mgnify:CR=1 FL=1
MYVISILISKIIYFFINLLKIGSGFTWSGHLVLELFPKTLKRVSHRLPEKVVVVSGTNGKTTTVKLLRHILETNGLKVLSNETGANLINGVVSSVLLNSEINGSLDYDVAVFELDELNLSEFLKVVKPDVLALLNLSRDQLDRYWEKEVILEKWEEAVKGLNEDSLLVLDEDQRMLRKLSKLHKGSTRYFNDDRRYLKNTNLQGGYNAKNVNCSLLVAKGLGLDVEKAVGTLSNFKYAYGRGEKFEYKNKNFRVLLAKNPESVNQNLSLLLEGVFSYDSVLYILNDNIPDGRDVSWIFDIEPELIKMVNQKKHLYISGTRALDMTVRIGYAGSEIDIRNVDSNLASTIEKIIKDENSKNIIVLPNYSAMLDFREITLGRKIL